VLVKVLIPVAVVVEHRLEPTDRTLKWLFRQLQVTNTHCVLAVAVKEVAVVMRLLVAVVLVV
jgi:hypothetical protein